MAVTTIEADLQGVVFMTYTDLLINWGSNVRDASSGNNVSTYTTAVTSNTAVEAALVTGRNGNYQGRCNRTFLFFDLSSITATDTVTAVTLKVRGGGFFNNGDTIIVDSSAWGGDGTTTTLSTSDYSNISHNTNLSSELATWTSTGYNDFTLNSQALTTINSDGYLNCAVIEHDHDYTNNNPSSGDILGNGIYFNHATDKIKVVVTHTTSGYGNEVIGVASANIGKVIGVETADIATVIGVS